MEKVRQSVSTQASIRLILQDKKGLEMKIIKKYIILILVVLCFVSGIACKQSPDTEAISSIRPTIDAVVTPSVTQDPNKASPTPVGDQAISFRDPNFETVIRKALSKNIGDILISDVQQIKELTARVCGIMYVDELKYFSSLEKLDLYGNRINDLTPISNLKSLKELNMGKNYNVLYSSNRNGLDISPLKSLVNLEVLDLRENMITDISALSSLAVLKKLDLTNNRISDISSLRNCVSLIELDISSNRYVNDEGVECTIDTLEPLYRLPYLRSIIANDCGIKNIRNISSLAALTYLEIGHNYIDDISPICFMLILGHVDVNHNIITDISCLNGDMSIRELNVSYNLISDFNVILNMHSLENIVWAGNPINDYTPINDFENKEDNEVENEPLQ